MEGKTKKTKNKTNYEQEQKQQSVLKPMERHFLITPASYISFDEWKTSSINWKSVLVCFESTFDSNSLSNSGRNEAWFAKLCDILAPNSAVSPLKQWWQTQTSTHTHIFIHSLLPSWSFRRIPKTMKLVWVALPSLQYVFGVVAVANALLLSLNELNQRVGVCFLFQYSRTWGKRRIHVHLVEDVR